MDKREIFFKLFIEQTLPSIFALDLMVDVGFDVDDELKLSVILKFTLALMRLI